MTRWAHAESLQRLAREIEPTGAELVAHRRRLDTRAMPQKSLFFRAFATSMTLSTGTAFGLLLGVSAAWLTFTGAHQPVEQHTVVLHPEQHWEWSDKVTVASEGTGQVEFVDAQPFVTWDDGLLEVEVEPHRGVEMVVRTPEATVRVIGTGFSVERDLYGTDVTVRHGKVSVTCRYGDERIVEAGGATRCFRSEAAGLGYAMQLKSSGASPQATRIAIEEALATRSAGESEARSELRALRTEVLVELGEIDEALRTADAYLRDDEAPRKIQILGLASRVALESGGCELAEPYLEELATAYDPAAIVLLSDCLAPKDPSRARVWLQRAQALNLTPEQLAAVKVRTAAISAPKDAPEKKPEPGKVDNEQAKREAIARRCDPSLERRAEAYDATAILLLHDCLAPYEPEVARGWLQRAQAIRLTPAQRQAVRARLKQDAP